MRKSIFILTAIALMAAAFNQTLAAKYNAVLNAGMNEWMEAKSTV